MTGNQRIMTISSEQVLCVRSHPPTPTVVTCGVFTEAPDQTPARRPAAWRERSRRISRDTSPRRPRAGTDVPRPIRS
jgi:hypothetical protein